MKLVTLCLSGFLSLMCLFGSIRGEVANHFDSTNPNIVLIMTDDQDLKLNSLDYQPLVKKWFRDQGTFFAKHYCTIAQCCPSRVSLLTGKAAHNTNVTDVRVPFGMFSSICGDLKLTRSRWLF